MKLKANPLSLILTFALCLTAWADTTGDVELVDVSDVNQVKTLQRFAQVSNMDGGIRIDYELSPKWPSAEFYAPEGYAWNLSKKEAVMVTLTNLGTSTERFFIHLGNPDPDHAKVKTIGVGRTDIAPGETKTIKVPVTTEGGFNPATVEFVRIFTGMHKAPVSVKLSEVVAVGVADHKTSAPVAAAAAPAAKPGANPATPSASGNFIDLSNLSQLKTDLRFASVSQASDGVIIDLELSPKWPSAEFLPSGNQTWNLSGYNFVDVTLTNMGSSKDRVFVYLANASHTSKNKAATESGRVDFAPGETKTIRLDLNGGTNFNPADIAAFRVFTGMHKAPVKLKLSSVTAVQ